MNQAEKEIVYVSLDDIIPNRFQPRLSFDEQGLNELAESIRQHGIIQPLVLRKIGDKFEIIAGERRYKASYIAGLSEVPAVILDLNDNESAEVAIVENIQRRDLSPIEEAKSYKKLLDRGYLTQDQLAGRMGKTQSTISNKLRLLNLDEKVQDALLNGKISERHARSLLKLENKEDQEEILNEILDKRLNVRDTEELILQKMSQEEIPEIVQFSDYNNADENEETFSFIQNPLSNKENLDNLRDLDSILDNVNTKVNVPILDDDIEVIEDIDMLDNDVNIELILEKINKLVDELKQQGINIKLDKYDFDELYQFVIKIEK